MAKVALIGSLITFALACAMLGTGTINTMATKYQDIQIVKGFGDAPPQPFEHPFFQTGVMFVGELLCLFVYYASVIVQYIKRKYINKEVEKKVDEKKLANPLVFWIPAACDLMGTTLLNLGLIFTQASVYQMLRGSVVVFNALFSMIFLCAKLYPHHFLGVFLISVGLAIVGYSSVVFDKGGDSSAKNPLLGDILVVLACMLAAVQFVVEEKFISKYESPPLQVVGWEGFFGLTMTCIVLFILYWLPGSDYHRLENAPYAIAQIWNSPILAVFVFGSALSIAFFNFFGISVTKRISSTTRSTIDALRTVLVWIVSLALGLETFNWLQLGGFAVLASGTFYYNNLLHIPFGYSKWYRKKLLQRAEKNNKVKVINSDPEDIADYQTMEEPTFL